MFLTGAIAGPARKTIYLPIKSACFMIPHPIQQTIKPALRVVFITRQLSAFDPPRRLGCRPGKAGLVYDRPLVERPCQLPRLVKIFIETVSAPVNGTREPFIEDVKFEVGLN